MIPSPADQRLERGPLKHCQIINFIACSSYECSNGVKSVTLPMQCIRDHDKKKDEATCRGGADNIHHIDFTDSCIGFCSPYNLLEK